MSAEPSTGAQPTPTGGQPAPTGVQPAPTGAQPAPTGALTATGAQPASAGAQPTPTGAQPAPTDARPTPTDAPPTPNGGVVLLRITGTFGAVLGYGCLAAFLYLISMQIYQWFRDGDWTHIGVADGMNAWLTRCCVKDGDTGRLAALAHWLDAPSDWLGLHKVLEILPASLLLFALSILGNSIFIYCRDRSDARRRADSVRGS
jgi:hypothetical protein